MSEAAPISRYWYRVTTFVCPLCGHEDWYRERVYTEKPEDYADRFQLIEEWCGSARCGSPYQGSPYQGSPYQ